MPVHLLQASAVRAFRELCKCFVNCGIRGCECVAKLMPCLYVLTVVKFVFVVYDCIIMGHRSSYTVAIRVVEGSFKRL